MKEYAVGFKDSFSAFSCCISHPLIPAPATEDLLSQLFKGFNFEKVTVGNKILEHKNVAIYSYII